MALLGDLTSRDAILQAIAEFDRIGRDQFLMKYGFKPARSYFLIYSGRTYDSKAIAGAAYGYQFPDRGPLASKDFSGGDATVRPRLESLGFQFSDGSELKAGELTSDRLTEGAI